MIFTEHFSDPGGAIGRVSDMSVCPVRTIIFELIDLLRRYLARWLTVTLRRSSLTEITVHGHGRKNVAKVVGATSSEGFLVTFMLEHVSP